MSIKVLFTGALGSIGRRIIPLMPDGFELVLTDRTEGKVGDLKVQALDITDYNAVLAALQGVDAVVHLAIASSLEFVTDEALFNTHLGEEYLRFNEASIEVNIRGTYHVFEAARHAGIKRIVYGSSMTVYLGAPAHSEFTDDMAPRPSNFYAVSKLFGEQLAEFFVRAHDLSITCLRFGTPHPQPEHHKYKEWVAIPVGRRTLVTYRDLADAVSKAVLAQDPANPRFLVSTVVSLEDNLKFDVSNGKEFGWQPLDYCALDGTVTPVDQK